MKPLIFILTLIFTSMLMGKDKSLRVVDTVDLKKYAGTWYEIARLPNRFQIKCVGDVTANYTLLDDGRIKVVNRCRTENDKYIEAEGIARLADKDGPNSKLKVRFAPRFLSFLPFVWGDYWIIDLDPDYRYAVVGAPNRKYLWILSREPEIQEDTFKKIIERINEQGYDAEELVRTKHLAE